MSTNPTPQAFQQPGDELSLGDLLAILWNGRWVILGCATLTLLLASYYAMRATPIYKVEAMLQIEPKKSSGMGNLGTLSESIFDMPAEAQTEQKIVKSNLVLGRTVEALHLDIVASPVRSFLERAFRKQPLPQLEIESFEVPTYLRGTQFQLRVGTDGTYTLESPEKQVIGEGRIGEELTTKYKDRGIKLQVRQIDALPGQRFNLVRHPLLSAIQGVRGSLVVSEEVKMTNVLDMSLEHSDPVKGAEILNTILAQYIRQNIERKAEEASNQLNFLQEQMPLLRGKLDVAEDRLNQFRAGSGSVDLSEEAKLMLQQSVNLGGQMLTLRQKREELLRTYQAGSDIVGTLDQQIVKLQGESRKVEGQVKGLPRTQQEVLRLTQDLQVNQQLYAGLLNSSQQLQMAKAGEIGNARIVDHSTPSLGPIKPQKSQIMALGTMLGVLLGVGIVMLRRALHNGVEDPHVLESSFGLPVLATIPHSQIQTGLLKKKGLGQLLGTANPDDMAMESLRSLRTSLHFTMMDAPNHVIMIAGPAPQIGKSFVSANFAFVLAQGGARVLLVDADLRKGKLHRHLGMEDRQSGLSEILSGQLDWQMAVREVQGLHLITTGTLPPNPAELLMGQRLGTFLKEASSFFDYILLDTPPVLAVTDAMIAGAHAAAVLVTLKAGLHTLAEVRAIIQRLEAAGIKPKGFILNDINSIGSRYGHNRYAYQYGYTNQTDRA